MKMIQALGIAVCLVVPIGRLAAQSESEAEAKADAAAVVESPELSEKPSEAVPPAPQVPTATSAPAPTATVTLPYAELKRLWEAAQDEKIEPEDDGEPEPPVAAILHSADYRLEFSGRDLLLGAVYRAENLDDEWQRLPLLRGGFGLMEIEPTDALVVRGSNDAYDVLLPPKSKLDLELKFAAPETLPSTWWVEQTLPEFQPAPAAVQRLSRGDMPNDVRLTFGGIEWAPAAPGSGDEAPRVLPAGSEGIDWALTKTEAGSPAGMPVEDAKPVPVPWQLRSELFVAFDDGRLGFQLRVHAHTDAENGGRLLHLLLPAGARGISAEGDGLLRHREIARAKATDPRRLELVWSDADRAEREFSVEFELAQSPLAAQWTLPLPTSDPPGESAALAVVRVNEGLEISGEDLRAAAESAGLPRWMDDAAEGGDFVSLDLDASRAIDIRWLPRVNTAPAVVAEARAITRLVADGALLNHAEYRIDHDAPLHWSLSLPAGSELLTAFVDGVATRPIQRDVDTLELQLPAPKETRENTAAGQTLVQLTYAGSVEAFDPVSGSVALALPETPLFVHRLLWDVHLPERYETSAIDGNVAIDANREHCRIDKAGDSEAAHRENEAPEGGERAIQLRKDLLRNEAPQVEIFYRSILTSS